MNLELFSCSGGLAEGLRRAGVFIDMAIDHDAIACDSYEANLGHRPVQLDTRDLLRMARAGWSPGPIDLFVADPPCTPWSRAGKRLGVADERDMLGITVELVALFRPRAYLIANVPGLDDGPNWPIVQRTIGGLARAGYCVADFARLDAANYGVPQHRHRPFWFGHRGGPCLTWPEPTHCDPVELRTLAISGTEIAPWVTVRQALAHLPPEEMGRPVRLRWKSNCHPPSRLDGPSMTIPASQPGNGGMTVALRQHVNHRTSDGDAPARTITGNPNSDGALLTHPRHPINRADEPSFCVTSKGDGRGAQGACCVEWPWDRPSTTVDTKNVLATYGRNGRDGSSQRGNPNAIVLSERAAAVLQGFPDGWTFAGKTKRSRWAQIGMAMPPPLAAAVGNSIARQMRIARVA